MDPSCPICPSLTPISFSSCNQYNGMIRYKQSFTVNISGNQTSNTRTVLPKIKSTECYAYIIRKNLQFRLLTRTNTEIIGDTFLVDKRQLLFYSRDNIDTSFSTSTFFYVRISEPSIISLGY